MFWFLETNPIFSGHFNPFVHYDHLSLDLFTKRFLFHFTYLLIYLLFSKPHNYDIITNAYTTENQQWKSCPLYWPLCMKWKTHCNFTSYTHDFIPHLNSETQNWYYNALSYCNILFVRYNSGNYKLYMFCYPTHSPSTTAFCFSLLLMVKRVGTAQEPNYCHDTPFSAPDFCRAG